MNKVNPPLAELWMEEMSTTRMQHGEPFITIWVKGPRFGHVGMFRIDTDEAARMVEALNKVLK